MTNFMMWVKLNRGNINKKGNTFVLALLFKTTKKGSYVLGFLIFFSESTAFVSFVLQINRISLLHNSVGISQYMYTDNYVRLKDLNVAILMIFSQGL